MMIAWIKKNYPYAGAIMALLTIPYVLVTTPSFSDSRKKFSIMKNDIEIICQNGGTVVSRKEVNKYGVADVTVELFAGSLSSDVRKKNAATMINLGWIPINEHGNQYCKDGMLYSSYFSDEDVDNNKIVVMNFRYTSQTVETCKKVSPSKNGVTIDNGGK